MHRRRAEIPSMEPTFRPVGGWSALDGDWRSLASRQHGRGLACPARRGWESAQDERSSESKRVVFTGCIQGVYAVGHPSADPRRSMVGGGAGLRSRTRSFRIGRLRTLWGCSGADRRSIDRRHGARTGGDGAPTGIDVASRWIAGRTRTERSSRRFPAPPWRGRCLDLAAVVAGPGAAVERSRRRRFSGSSTCRVVRCC